MEHALTRRGCGGLLVVSVCLSAGALAAGCSSAAPERTSSTGEALGACSGTQASSPGGSIDPNDLMTDGDMTGCTDISASDIQAFLQAKGSMLASYTENGKTAAQIIATQSETRNINPVYILARIETESSLVTSGNANANASEACGCGCPDSGGCDPSLSGFAAQIDCATVYMNGYLSDLASIGHTTSGWAVGQANCTSDPCTVTPANKATAALYTYTPWVGAYGTTCGTTQYGGSSLVALLYRQYKASFPSCSGSSGGGGGGSGVATETGACTDSEYAAQLQGTTSTSFWVCQGNGRYICDGQHHKVVEACPNGCTPQGTKVDDQCNGTGAPQCTSSEYAAQNVGGASFWTCEGNARYVCDGRNDKVTESCPNGCTREGTAVDDQCNGAAGSSSGSGGGSSSSGSSGGGSGGPPFGDGGLPPPPDLGAAPGGKGGCSIGGAGGPGSATWIAPAMLALAALLARRRVRSTTCARSMRLRAIRLVAAASGVAVVLAASTSHAASAGDPVDTWNGVTAYQYGNDCSSVYATSGTDAHYGPPGVFTDSCGFQCVELAVRYFYFKAGITGSWSGVGQATDMCGTHPSGVAQTSSPQVGDLMVFQANNAAAGTGSAGHVAVITKINGDGTIGTFNQRFAEDANGFMSTAFWNTAPASAALCYLHAVNSQPVTGGGDGTATAAGTCTDAEYQAQLQGTTGTSFWVCQGNTRYICDGLHNKVIEACPGGCTAKGTKIDDQCSGSGAPQCSSSEYAGQNVNGASFWTCQGNTRYVCDGLNDKVTEQCPYGCIREGNAVDDQCAPAPGSDAGAPDASAQSDAGHGGSPDASGGPGWDAGFPPPPFEGGPPPLPGGGPPASSSGGGGSSGCSLGASAGAPVAAWGLAVACGALLRRRARRRR